MTYYEPHATLVEIDPTTRTYRLTIQVLYPAGVTQGTTTMNVSGTERHVTVEAVDDRSIASDHLVTSTVDYQRTAHENEVEVAVEKDKKPKGEVIIIYDDARSNAA